MRTLEIRYFDRQAGKVITVPVPSDCLKVIVGPSPDDVPALEIEVNTDMVQIFTPDGQKLGGLDYSDLINDALNAGEYTPPDTIEERWVFTAPELDEPEKCNREDEFLATGPGINELGVIVQRNGVVTNRYGDGTAGVPDAERDLADAIESYTDSFETGETADYWRDVLVDSKTGNFVRWLRY